MKLNKLIEEVYSPRIKFRCNFIDNKIDVIDNDNNVIGYIIEKQQNDIIVLEFDLDKKNHNIGLQTEILREYLRYKYLWEKYEGVIRCYPKINETINILNKRHFIKENDYYIINKDIYFSYVEKLSLFDDKLNRISYPNFRGEKIGKGTYAGIVDVIIKNIKTNKYLTTKRDINKPTSPGLWEITGGGIDYEEEIEKALIREAKEETGLDIINYEYLGNFFIGDLVYFSYIAYVSCQDSDVLLQKGETIDYKWRTKDELIELFNTDLVPKKQKFRIMKLINKI